MNVIWVLIVQNVMLLQHLHKVHTLVSAAVICEGHDCSVIHLDSKIYLHNLRYEQMAVCILTHTHTSHVS